MNKQLIKGTLVGLIAPILAFIVYVAYATEESDPISVFKRVLEIGRLAHVISLSLLINLLIFYMNIKKYKDWFNLTTVIE